jgi:succinate dehydrogenase / fumarate reductase iron-sulfur subunit
MRSFPVVDGSPMFAALERMRARAAIDAAFDLGCGPRQSALDEARRYHQLGGDDFVGTFAINRVRLFNAHPTGALAAPARWDARLGVGGIQGCDNARSCVASSPRQIARTASIAAMNRAVDRRALARPLER